MFLYIIITILASISIILIGHHLWNYLKDNYSTKKTNYLVGSQIEKYKHIIKEIQEEPIHEDPSDLKLDLEDFIKDLQN